jgi:hypothetical protein
VDQDVPDQAPDYYLSGHHQQSEDGCEEDCGAVAHYACSSNDPVWGFKRMDRLPELEKPVKEIRKTDILFWGGSNQHEILYARILLGPWDRFRLFGPRRLSVRGSAQKFLSHLLSVAQPLHDPLHDPLLLAVRD